MDFVLWGLLGVILSVVFLCGMDFWANHLSKGDMSCGVFLLLAFVIVLAEIFLPLFSAKIFGGKGLDILFTYIGFLATQGIFFWLNSSDKDFESKINRYE